MQQNNQKDPTFHIQQRVNMLYLKTKGLEVFYILDACRFCQSFVTDLKFETSAFQIMDAPSALQLTELS